MLFGGCAKAEQEKASKIEIDASNIANFFNRNTSFRSWFVDSLIFYHTYLNYQCVVARVIKKGCCFRIGHVDCYHQFF